MLSECSDLFGHSLLLTLFETAFETDVEVTDVPLN